MPQIMDRSRTIVRGLAKEGLMDDGKEDLLESVYRLVYKVVPTLISLTP